MVLDKPAGTLLALKPAPSSSVLWKPGVDFSLLIHWRDLTLVLLVSYIPEFSQHACTVQVMVIPDVVWLGAMMSLSISGHMSDLEVVLKVWMCFHVDFQLCFFAWDAAQQGCSVTVLGVRVVRTSSKVFAVISLDSVLFMNWMKSSNCVGPTG